MRCAKWLFVAATSILASVSAPAFAQWSPGLQGVTNDVLGSVNRPLINSDGIEDDPEYADSPSESDYTDGPNARLKSTYGQPTPRVSPPPAQAIARLDFSPSQSVRRASIKLFLDALGKASPEDAANLRAIGDPIAMMQPELAKAGLRTNDLADAFALYWVVAWRVAHGQLTEPDDRLFAAVRRQTGPILAGLSRMDRIGPADRQSMTESLLLHALLLEMNRNAALEAPDWFSPARLADAARRDARLIGLDLDAYRLSFSGFVLAK